MADRADLARWDYQLLAAKCKEVAMNTNSDEETSERAWNLLREYVHLTAQQPVDYKASDQLKDEQRKLTARMVDFLAAAL